MRRRTRYVPALATAVCGHWTQLFPAQAPAGLWAGVGALDAIGPGTALGAQEAIDAGAVLRSADGGRTWRHSGTRLARPPGVQGPPLLSFSDANHGWLVLGGITWRTADGGVTWTRG